MENNQILFLLVTYLVSSIPFGLILTKIFLKKDIRSHGSGNIGATNVTRIAGKKLGIVTLILDALKGAVMVVLAMDLFALSDDFDLLIALTAFIAVIGHIFPIYLRFKGGKGVATAAAVIMVIDPLIGSLVFLIWLALFLSFRVSAVASLGAVASLIPLCYFLAFSHYYTYLAIALTILITIRHKENIERLILKKENKF